jgi:hypothetical protein
VEGSEYNDDIIKNEMSKWCKAVFVHKPEDGYR